MHWEQLDKLVSFSQGRIKSGYNQIGACQKLNKTSARMLDQMLYWMLNRMLDWMLSWLLDQMSDGMSDWMLDQMLDRTSDPMLDETLS